MITIIDMDSLECEIPETDFRQNEIHPGMLPATAYYEAKTAEPRPFLANLDIDTFLERMYAAQSC